MSFVGQVQPIFTANCSCHLSDPAPQGLKLTMDVSRANLLMPSEECRAPLARNRVVPGVANESYLIWKVVGMDPTTGGALCAGQRMPRSGPPFLPNDQIDTIRRWIDQGALDN